MEPQSIKLEYKVRTYSGQLILPTKITYQKIQV